MLIQDEGSSSLLETKFELMLNMQNQKTKKEIDALRHELELLSQELIALKRNSVSKPREEQQTTLIPRDVPVQQFQQQPQVQQVQQQAQQQQNQQGTQARSRTGNFTQDDVSIEKMFYFGGGRR